jgi:hypothetical protein
VSRPPVQDDIDRLSLEQALIDFERANRRVTDLTRRLIELSEENRVLRKELELMHFRRYMVDRLRRVGLLRRLGKSVRRRMSEPE